MALSARSATAASTPNIASAHMQQGGRNVASVDFAPISEISANAHVQPDANFDFQGFSGGQGRRQHGHQPLANYGGNIDTNSSTFLNLMNQGQPTAETANAAGQVKGAFHGLLSRAIRAYEGTSAVIHGTQKTLGSSYSATL